MSTPPQYPYPLSFIKSPPLSPAAKRHSVPTGRYIHNPPFTPDSASTLDMQRMCCSFGASTCPALSSFA